MKNRYIIISNIRNRLPGEVGVITFLYDPNKIIAKLYE